MVWFRVDDSFASHPKVRALPREVRAAAIGTWTLAGTWSANHLTDGSVPAYMIDELGGSVEGALALVRVRLWLKVRGGFQFKSWEEYQPTRAQVEAQREAERTRKARQRKKSQGQPEDTGGSPSGSPGPVPAGHQRDTGGSPDTPSRPDPTRPIGTHVSPSTHEPERERERDGRTDDDLASRAKRFAFDGERIRGELAKVLGERPDADAVMRYATTVLGRAAAPADDATAYLVGSIRQSEVEAQQIVFEVAS